MVNGGQVKKVGKMIGEASINVKIEVPFLGKSNTEKCGTNFGQLMPIRFSPIPYAIRCSAENNDSAARR
jgi:hypothetical protein